MEQSLGLAGGNREKNSVTRFNRLAQGFASITPFGRFHRFSIKLTFAPKYTALNAKGVNGKSEVICEILYPNSLGRFRIQSESPVKN
jgi:hypothetical protein